MLRFWSWGRLMDEKLAWKRETWVLFPTTDCTDSLVCSQLWSWEELPQQGLGSCQINWLRTKLWWCKVEKILKGCLDLISSPSVKIQIMGMKVCLRRKGKTLLGIVNKLFVFKSLLTTSSNVLTSHLSHPEFSLKVKAMGSNPGYLLKSFLL